MSSGTAVDLSRMIRVYEDGRVEWLKGTDTVPPSLDGTTGVQSKDVTISSETGLQSRIYIPTPPTSDPKKLPLLVYYHGGEFIEGSPQDPTLDNYLNSLVSEANVVVVSVAYRMAPEYRLPIAYEDSWAALKWVASHSGGEGQEEWLNTYADFSRVYLAGDSAGGNITHRMAMMFGAEKINGIDQISGIILFSPYFWGSEPVGNETTNKIWRAAMAAFWKFVKPTTSGVDDPDINPAMDPNLSSLGCSRVLVTVGGADPLGARGWYYATVLGERKWVGDIVEVMGFMREGHDFQLLDPTSDNAVALMKRVVAFLNDGSN